MASTTQPDKVTETQDLDPDLTPIDTDTPSVESKDQAPSPEFDGNRMLLNMVSDPDIQAILTARREGRDVTVISGKDVVAPETKETLPDHIDEESYGEFDDDMKRVVKALDKQIASKIDPLVEKLTVLENLAQGYEQRAMTDQISQVSAKHPDFNKYSKDMAKIARAEGAGLGVEELFLLAKHRAGELSLSEPSTHSERPTPTPRRKGSPLNKSDKEQPPSSRRRFQVTLADALDNLNLPH